MKAHLFLSMLADYAECHLRRAWQSLLCLDETESLRRTPIAPVEPSARTKQKKGTARTKEGLPRQTFRGLVQSLATLSRDQIRLGETGPLYTRTAKPTALQAKAFDLLDLNAL